MSFEVALHHAMRGLQVARINPQFRILAVAHAFSVFSKIKGVALVDVYDLLVLLFDSFCYSLMPQFVIVVETHVLLLHSRC